MPKLWKREKRIISFVKGKGRNTYIRKGVISLAIWFILGFFLLTSISLGYYFYIERPKLMKKKSSNVIELQNDGFDFVLYKGKIKELVYSYKRYFADMDIIIYSRSLFIGFTEPKRPFVDLPAKAIQSVKYEPNKLTIYCFREISGTDQIVIKGDSYKNLFTIARKIEFISKRSKRIKAI